MDMILLLVIKNTKTDEEMELTYQQICDKIKDAQWVFLRGGIHLKMLKVR